MSLHQVRASGHQAQRLVTRLLQRSRLAAPGSGVWEAADVQWWSRQPRRSDDLEQLFWLDDDGPVAGVLLTLWDEFWQVDPLLVPGAGPSLETVWAELRRQVEAHVPAGYEVLLRDDDQAAVALAQGDGLVAGDRSGCAWIQVADRPAMHALPDGYLLVDRTQRADQPHWMRKRSGDQVAERLARCSLYDPWLDLAVETTDGEVAGYVLFWADPVTRVGLVEPVRTEDAHQGRGLARAVITAGVERLAERGMSRVKIGFGLPGAGGLYESIGFRDPATLTGYERPA